MTGRAERNMHPRDNTFTDTMLAAVIEVQSTVIGDMREVKSSIVCVSRFAQPPSPQPPLPRGEREQIAAHSIWLPGSNPGLRPIYGLV